MHARADMHACAHICIHTRAHGQAHTCTFPPGPLADEMSALSLWPSLIERLYSIFGHGGQAQKSSLFLPYREALPVETSQRKSSRALTTSGPCRVQAQQPSCGALRGEAAPIAFRMFQERALHKQ